jgi:hypothetical protein
MKTIHMIQVVLSALIFLAFGCGPQYYLPENEVSRHRLW